MKWWLLLALVSSSAQGAGTESSGGGAGIFCPASVSGQPAVQLLDLYEGKIMEGYTFTDSADPYLSQLTATLELFRFDFSLFIDFKKTLTAIQGNIRFLPPGVSIHVPSDMGGQYAVPVPTGCTLGAIGFYQADGKLVISTDAFQSLSETQKAAFFAHEVLYKMQRTQRGSLNGSVDTRRLVANVFSDQKTPISLEELSRPMHFSDFDDYGSWSPVLGKESFLMGRGQNQAILVDSKPERFKVRFLNSKKYADYVSFYCKKGGDGKRRIDLRIPDDAPLNDRSVELPIPSDCAGLTIYASSDSQFELPGNSPSRFEIELDGEKWLEGELSQGTKNGASAVSIGLEFYLSSDLL